MDRCQYRHTKFNDRIMIYDVENRIPARSVCCKVNIVDRGIYNLYMVAMYCTLWKTMENTENYFKQFKTVLTAKIILNEY